METLDILTNLIQEETLKHEKAVDDLILHIRKREAYIDRLRLEFKDCVNELCLKCGAYHEEHLGACDSCRWLKPRHSHGYLDEPGGEDE